MDNKPICAYCKNGEDLVIGANGVRIFKRFSDGTSLQVAIAHKNGCAESWVDDNGSSIFEAIKPPLSE
jgi:hypothetical protein